MILFCFFIARRKLLGFRRFTAWAVLTAFYIEVERRYCCCFSPLRGKWTVKYVCGSSIPCFGGCVLRLRRGPPLPCALTREQNHEAQNPKIAQSNSHLPLSTPSVSWRDMYVAVSSSSPPRGYRSVCGIQMRLRHATRGG